MELGWLQVGVDRGPVASGWLAYPRPYLRRSYARANRAAFYWAHPATVQAALARAYNRPLRAPDDCEPTHAPPVGDSVGHAKRNGVAVVSPNDGAAIVSPDVGEPAHAAPVV